MRKCGARAQNAILLARVFNSFWELKSVAKGVTALCLFISATPRWCVASVTKLPLIWQFLSSRRAHTALRWCAQRAAHPNLPLTRLSQKGEIARAKLLLFARYRGKPNTKPLCGDCWVFLLLTTFSASVRGKKCEPCYTVSQMI